MAFTTLTTEQFQNLGNGTIPTIEQFRDLVADYDQQVSTST